MYKLLEV